jgi:hypothetical protein
MPNWCNNFIELKHEDPAMIQRAYDAMERGEFLNEFIPVPLELREATANGSTNEQLIEKYGYSDWYGYCTNEWGTKWDVGEQGNADINPNDPTVMTAGFDSAWAPPTAAYEKLMDLGFEIRAGYYESGMAYCGQWEDGNDDYYDLSEMSADQVEDAIPAELNDLFGISETIREYEEPEELTEWIKDGVEQRKEMGLE